MTFQGSIVGLGTAAAVLCFSLGCGQDDSAREQVERAKDAVKTEFNGAVDAAREGAVADAARAVAEATDKATKEAQKKGAAAAAASKAGNVADELEKNIENSVQVAEDAYAKARKDGAGRLEAAGDAYDAVDQTHEE